MAKARTGKAPRHTNPVEIMRIVRNAEETYSASKYERFPESPRLRKIREIGQQVLYPRL
jgi:hypothetical protein